MTNNKVQAKGYFTYEESIPLWITFVIYESILNTADFPPSEGFRFSQVLRVRVTVTAAWTEEDATKLCVEGIEGSVDEPRNSYVTFSLFKYLSLFIKEKETQESVMELVDKYLSDK